MPLVTAGDVEGLRSKSFHSLRDRNTGKTSSSQMDGRQPRDRSRVFWQTSHDRTLLDLMVDQVRQGGKLGNGFRKDSWKHILCSFNSKFSLRYDVQQLKHRLKYYRNQYRLVKAFIERGFSWNKDSQILIAPSELWESYIKENPLAARYKDKRWPYFEDWCKIFVQTTSVGGQLSIASPTNDIEDEGMMENSDGETDPQRSNSPPGSPQSIQEANQNPNNIGVDDGYVDQDQENKVDNPRIQRPSQRRNAWKHKATSLHAVLDDVIDAVPVKALPSIEPAEDRWPVEKCIEELNSMESLEEDLFLKALLVFRDEYNRRVFLSIKEDRRRAWLRLICG